MADFIVECMGVEELPDENAPRDVWKLYVDGSATESGSRQELSWLRQQDINFTQPSGLNLKLPTTSQSMKPFWQDYGWLPSLKRRQSGVSVILS